MTKSTPEVLTRFVFKSSPEAFISPLFFKNKFTLGLHLDFYRGTPLIITECSRKMYTKIIVMC